MDKLQIRTIFKYEFLLGTNAVKTTNNINQIFGNNAVSVRTVRIWFEKFRLGNFKLQNEPRGRPESKVDNNKLKIAIESNPCQSASKLAVQFKVSKPTILTHLQQIGKVKMENKWVTEAESATTINVSC